MRKYSEYTDEQLLNLTHSGTNEADEVIDFIIKKYKPLVRKKANALFLIGGETEDLIQEGMIGLFKAIRDYHPEQGTSFGYFAEVCVNRQLYSALTASNRKKNAPLNSYVSFSQPTGENQMPVEELFMESPGDGNPEKMFIEKELWEEFWKHLEKKLSKMEKQVLQLYLEGNPYASIAELMGKSPKSIDNALQRIRQKIGSMKVGD